jgi:hypothetical protein
MPYSIEKVKGGFLVCDDKKCFSKRPLTKKKAEKQRIAIALSEHRKMPEIPIKNYFV